MATLQLFPEWQAQGPERRLLYVVHCRPSQDILRPGFKREQACAAVMCVLADAPGDVKWRAEQQPRLPQQAEGCGRTRVWAPRRSP
ncbi:unnamed protein product [Gadus morhua 'NCC']